MSTWKKSHAIDPFAWAARYSAHIGPDRRRDGSTPWRFKIAHTLEGAMTLPMVASSPWMRRQPQVAFSFAKRETSAVVPFAMPGRPGRRCG